MLTENRTKINQLLANVPQGVVLQSSWLLKEGYSLDLQKYYRNSGWLKALGNGAMFRSNNQPGYKGGVYALQKQSGLSIHPGGRSALALQGKAHYIELNTTQIWLFGGEKEKLPTWFRKHKWDQQIQYKSSSFLPKELGLTEFSLAGFSIKVASPARAIMECLYLSPENFNLVECYELMENLNDLRPTLVQELLEACTSIKVKRLFLFMAEKLNHSWFKHLNLSKVDLGKGKRSLVKEGIYIPKYQITVPKTLVYNEQ
ncbi:MAG: type IV toxin-antitoxin system AbiEi family antitoxin [Sediminibacterium sp.]|nr:type IV toxin-antitoxin system AbiEi family antitoxin [Sediminibacterium sp.]